MLYGPCVSSSNLRLNSHEWHCQPAHGLAAVPSLMPFTGHVRNKSQECGRAGTFAHAREGRQQDDSPALLRQNGYGVLLCSVPCFMLCLPTAPNQHVTSRQIVIPKAALKRQKIRKFQKSKIRKFQNSKIPKFENSKIRKFENSKNRKFEKSKNQKFQNSQIQKFQNSKITKV